MPYISTSNKHNSWCICEGIETRKYMLTHKHVLFSLKGSVRVKRCFCFTVFITLDTMLLLPIILLSIFAGLLVYYLFSLKQRYQYFSQRNIPTPPFEFFFGHIRMLWKAPFYHRQLENWTKRYGKIYGLYEGTVPMFVVSDLDFLQEVFVKQFSVFSARKASLFDGLFSNVFLSFGPAWRRQRHLINPSFTAAKLKTMSPLINGCISSLMEKLSNHAENGDEFDIHQYYKRMSMDVICKSLSIAFSFPLEHV